eukprot:scaffold122939_cov14-Tisochrysis_lutea.AAC.1
MHVHADWPAPSSVFSKSLHEATLPAPNVNGCQNHALPFLVGAALGIQGVAGGSMGAGVSDDGGSGGIAPHEELHALS